MTFWRKILFSFIMLSLLFSLFIVEVGFRVLRFDYSSSSKIDYVHREGGDCFQWWTFPVNSSFIYRNVDGAETRVLTDQFGLRNPPGTELTSLDFVILGDSFAAAVNTDDRLTVAGRMRSEGLRVFNEGVDGFGTANEIGLAQSLGGITRPRVFVLLFYLGNDFRDNYVNFNPKLHSGVPCKSENVTRLSDFFRRSLTQSHFANYLYQRLVVNWYRVRKRTDIRTDLASYQLNELELMRKQPDPEIAQVLKRTALELEVLAQFVHSQSSKLLVVGVPSLAQVTGKLQDIASADRDPRLATSIQGQELGSFSFDLPDQYLAKICEDLGLPYLPLLVPFRERGARNLFNSKDFHWNDQGQAIAVEMLDKYFSDISKLRDRPHPLGKSEK